MIISKNYLVDLYARTKRAIVVKHRENAKLEILMNNGFLLQDIIASVDNPSWYKLQNLIYSEFHSLFGPPVFSYRQDIWPKIYWWWYVKIKPISMKTLSVICAIASVLIVWSESTFQFYSISGVKLSIPQLFLSSSTISYGGLEFMSLMFTIFLCAYVYTPLLQIKLFDLYQMVPQRNTDEPTLLFVGTYLSKLTLPIIYNFLNMGGLADPKIKNGDEDFTLCPAIIQVNVKF